ncbi:ATP-dependent helicase, C-terminal, partial [Dillenia turbinata]
DALGITLEEILKIVPGGCLIFFPSYKLMEKLCSRWRGTGQWAQLNALKTLFVEPRGGSQDEFEPILKDYYETICQADKPTFGRKRRGKQMGLTMSQSTELPVTSKRTGGAAFLAVCRGKVSEGIDFSDENARAVIIVGIPFPNINDIKVSQKKKYNDTYKLSRSLLSGSQWYCQQAFRALNQAAGRCIRHRFDYGAIILLDERYKEERNVAYVSKWLRNALRQYDRFDAALLELQSFFGNAEEKYGKRSVSIQNIDIDVENISSIVQKKGVVKKKQLRSNSLDGYWRVVSKQEETEKSTSFSQCLTLDQKDHASISQLKTQSDVEAKAEDTVSCKEIIGSEYSFKNKPRCTEVVSVSSSYEDPDVSVVKETPDVDDGASMISFEAPRDDYSSSTVILCSSELPVQSFDSIPLSLSSAPSDEKWSSPDTPKGNISEITSSLIPEKELSLNRSVNSHTQKRRRSISSLSTKLTQEEQVDDPDIQIPQGVRVIESSMVENQRIQYVSNNQSTETKLNKKIVTNSPGMGTSPDETSGPVHSERLRIFCSICSSPLGLPANNFYMSCSLTSSSKVHLASLAKENVESSVDTSDTCILITDVSSVDQQLWNRSVEGDPLQSTWCEKDGCVFRTVFCPFCKSTDSCLGVQIMAADASNVRLLNKILFYLDHLEIKNFEPTITKPKDISPVASSDTERVAVLQYIDKFAYSPPPQQNSRGWRTKKSKLKLPRRGLLSDSRANG